MISVCGRKIRITGRFLRIARVDGDRHRFLDDPEPMVKALKGCGTRVDIFTFMQRLTEREPKIPTPWSGRTWLFCPYLRLIIGLQSKYVSRLAAGYDKQKRKV